MTGPLVRRGSYVAPDPETDIAREWFEWTRTLSVLIAVAAAALVAVGAIVGFVIGVNL